MAARYSSDGEKADVLRSKESRRPVDVVLKPNPEKNNADSWKIINSQLLKQMLIYFTYIQDNADYLVLVMASVSSVKK